MCVSPSGVRCAVRSRSNNKAQRCGFTPLRFVFILWTQIRAMWFWMTRLRLSRADKPMRKVARIHPLRTENLCGKLRSISQRDSAQNSLRENAQILRKFTSQKTARILQKREQTPKNFGTKRKNELFFRVEGLILDAISAFFHSFCLSLRAIEHNDKNKIIYNKIF